MSLSYLMDAKSSSRLPFLSRCICSLVKSLYVFPFFFWLTVSWSASSTGLIWTKRHYHCRRFRTSSIARSLLTVWSIGLLRTRSPTRSESELQIVDRFICFLRASFKLRLSTFSRRSVCRRSSLSDSFT